MKNRIVLALLLSWGTFGISAAAAPDLAIDKFVNDYYQATRKNDLQELRTLMLPASVACLDKVSPDYFKQDLSLSWHDAPATPPTWKMIDLTPYKSMPEFAQLPAAPVKGIQISWDEGTLHKSSTLAPMILLAQNEGRYVQVLPCLNADQIKKRNDFFARRKAER